VSIANDLIILENGDIVLTGQKDQSAFLAKFSSNGELKWERTFTRSGGIHFNSIKETPNRGFILTGFNVTNGILIKLDEDGNL
jgi:hypothetical protein